MANPYLNNFIQNLSLPEIKVIEEHLRKIPTADKASKENKDYKLFQTILSNKGNAISEKELSIITNSSSSALRTLKSRLFDKIIEVLIHDEHILNETLFDKHSSLVFKLKKKILAVRTLNYSINREKTDVINHLLDEIIKEATENEIYDILIEALNSKKYSKGIRQGINEFDQINKQIEFYNYCNKALFFAADCYYKVIINVSQMNSSTKKEFDNYLSGVIKHIESDYKKTRSYQLNQYLLTLQFAYAERMQDYNKAIEYCNKLISLLKNNKVIYRKERMGLAYINLSQYKTFTGKYKEARIDCETARNFFPENNFNYILAVEHEFHIDFYESKYERAMTCLNKLLNHSLSDTGTIRKSKFIYFQAYTLFATAQYKESLSLLNTALEIEKSKNHWNIGLRILMILCNIELNRMNETSKLVDSLRKHIERTKKKEEISTRDQLIAKLLREIEKDGFLFNPKNLSAGKMLKQLSEKNKPHSWKHYTPELIPFDEWLGGKKN